MHKIQLYPPELQMHLWLTSLCDFLSCFSGYFSKAPLMPVCSISLRQFTFMELKNLGVHLLWLLICVLRYVTEIYRSTDTNSGRPTLVERLTFTQNCGSSSSKTGTNYYINDKQPSSLADDYRSISWTPNWSIITICCRCLLLSTAFC